jgi:Pyruvate/2-oxoacid:ferredoxin oxidoreductase gamma subunit
MQLKALLGLLIGGAFGISVGVTLALVGAIVYDGYWALFTRMYPSRERGNSV